MSGGGWASGTLVAAAGSTAATTTTTAQYTQPAIGSTVSVSVTNSAFMFAGMYLYIVGGGLYKVSSVTNSTTVVCTNLGDSGNAAAAATVSTSATVFDAGFPRYCASKDVETQEGTTSTSYVDLATVQAVTLVTGTSVLLSACAAGLNDTTNGYSLFLGYTVSGATTVAATWLTAVTEYTTTNRYLALQRTALVTGLTAGTNTFTLKFKSDNATGNSKFGLRNLTVWAL